MSQKRDMKLEAMILLEVLNTLEIDTVQDMEQVFNLCLAYQYELINEIVSETYFDN